MKQWKTQTIARVFGAMYLITFATSIPALILFQPVLDDPAGYIAGGGSDTRIYLGALLEFLLILSNIATAVVLVPLLRRHDEIFTVGYVTARIMECTFIAIGIICVLGIVSLRSDSPDAAALATSLAALKDWTFLLGPGMMVGVGNGLILGWLMYTSGLMPRPLAVLGLIAGPLLILSGIGVLFDLYEPGAGPQGVATIPEAVWELSLGIYPLVWGFRRTRVVEVYEAARQRDVDRALAPAVAAV
jgi:hypothetical protein